MSSSLGQAYFFTFNARACVCVCVCVCALFYIIFFTMVCILFRINFQIHLISHALRLAGSVSIGAVVGFRLKIDHHWLMFFLYRDLPNQYTQSTDKHALRTSKSCSWTLFRSRPFRFLLFCLVSLHQPLNDTLVSVEVLSFAWSSDIVSPTSFSCLQRLWIFCICTASAWCLLWIRLQMN